jgi:hypothetical protein
MVTRYSVAADVPEAMHQPYEAQRVYRNAVRNQHNPDQVDHRGSIMATRQQSRGQPSVRLDPYNEASRTHLSTAVRLGLVIETSPGFFIDAPQAAPAAPATAPIRAAAPVAPAAPPPPPTAPTAASWPRMTDPFENY